ncbi:uncharacterized protein LOC107435254 [Ziziphus jujuba]|uniref:Uncharacterized protein LOC107435254 n=2 Tax=Ziziphus jujuba TaxID=326968 RepID=A0A6P4BH27_ZIZJJ|nr:uncharacterized protein LOC107435254 [Ziziphus jujuba]KAH7521366.1 hypothetical protein FEM48_Zijuj07G0025500 [Ziziphus jujuba var. spinosa]
MIMSNWSNTHNCESSGVTNIDSEEDEHGSELAEGRDLWHARRAFLRSYHFSKQSGLKEKLRMSVKELNGMAMVVVSDIRRHVSTRRLGIRAFRFTMDLPSLFFISLRCYTPWIKKKPIKE